MCACVGVCMTILAECEWNELKDFTGLCLIIPDYFYLISFHLDLH